MHRKRYRPPAGDQGAHSLLFRYGGGAAGSGVDGLDLDLASNDLRFDPDAPPKPSPRPGATSPADSRSSRFSGRGVRVRDEGEREPTPEFRRLVGWRIAGRKKRTPLLRLRDSGSIGRSLEVGESGTEPGIGTEKRPRSSMVRPCWSSTTLGRSKV